MPGLFGLGVPQREPGFVSSEIAMFSHVNLRSLIATRFDVFLMSCLSHPLLHRPLFPSFLRKPLSLQTDLPKTRKKEKIDRQQTSTMQALVRGRSFTQQPLCVLDHRSPERARVPRRPLPSRQRPMEVEHLGVTASLAADSSTPHGGHVLWQSLRARLNGMDINHVASAARPSITHRRGTSQ